MSTAITSLSHHSHTPHTHINCGLISSAQTSFALSRQNRRSLKKFINKYNNEFTQKKLSTIIFTYKSDRAREKIAIEQFYQLGCVSVSVHVSMCTYVRLCTFRRLLLLLLLFISFALLIYLLIYTLQPYSKRCVRASE